MIPADSDCDWLYDLPDCQSKKAPEGRRAEKPLLPHELALQKLVALQQQKLWQKGDVKPYQSELTFIIREYLENRFNIQALESTTDEIVQNLPKS